jgi:GH3 auxin-responsive promoter
MPTRRPAALANAALRLAMATRGRWAHDRLLRAARTPREAQARTLGAILRACAKTDLGRANDLASLADPDAFRRRIPIQDYEQLRPWIERQITAGRPALAPERPIFYARTSGTTGQPKAIPVTRRVLHDLRRAQRAMAFVQHRAADAFAGSLLAIGGALCEERLPDGTMSGAVSGLIYGTMPALVRAKYVLPPAVFAIDDYELRYAVIARLAVECADITTIATANPSTILRLLDQIRRDLPVIVREMAVGQCGLLGRLEPGAAAAVRQRIGANPARARALAPLLARADLVTPEGLWPALGTVVTWLGGGCALAARTIASLLPPAARMIDFGYVASEMRGTIVVDADRDLALPLLEDVFFEFVPLERWERGDRETLLVDELEEGCDYQVIVTTFGGLVRYPMNDVLRAGPRIENTPTLRFLRKGRGMTSITGEKLSENQVSAAVTEVSRRLGAPVRFCILLADAERRRYRAFVEFAGEPYDPASFARGLDDGLSALNIEYAAKRGSGRLQAIEAVPLAPGAGESYRKDCVARGQREAQLKLPCLQNAEECRFDFHAHGPADAPC